MIFRRGSYEKLPEKKNSSTKAVFYQEYITRIFHEFIEKKFNSDVIIHCITSLNRLNITL